MSTDTRVVACEAVGTGGCGCGLIESRRARRICSDGLQLGVLTAVSAHGTPRKWMGSGGQAQGDSRHGKARH